MHAPSYMFIDGQYFWATVDRFRTEVLGVVELPLNLAMIAAQYTKVFYYDCELPKREKETAEQFAARQELYRQRNDAVEACDGFHVQLGTTVSEGKKVKQKGVDVQIAVDMMSHAFRGDVKALTLLSGDGDFAPLINQLVQLGLEITVLADRRTASRTLMAAADRKRYIDIHLINYWLADDARSVLQIPLPADSVTRVPDGGKMVRKGTSSLGVWVEEYRGPGQFTLAYDFKKPPLLRGKIGGANPFGRMTHADEALLIRVFEEMGGRIEWEGAGGTA